jgi:signal transduction histidine kinase
MRNMGNNQHSTILDNRDQIPEFVVLVQEILLTVKQSISRIDFLEKASRIILEFLQCDLVELRVCEEQKYYRCRINQEINAPFISEMISYAKEDENQRVPAAMDGHVLELLSRLVFTGNIDGSSLFLSSKGSFWTNDTELSRFSALINDKEHELNLAGETEVRSLAIIPVSLKDRLLGLMIILSRRKDFFTTEGILQNEAISNILATAMSHQRTTAALQERVKELTCLYDINEAVRRSSVSLDDILKEIADLITRAWRYPEIASSRIRLDGNVYLSGNFRDGPSRIRASILVNKMRRGEVEVIYSEERPKRDEGPFLYEERKLIEAIAQKISTIITDKEAEQEREQLKDQLHHADRLATIGQLASGVAHEINEPLAGILGFSQLVLKDESLSPQARKDLGKIKSSALHTREIVKKLLFFSRQMPSRKMAVNPNTIIREVLAILEGHIKKAKVNLVMRLQPGIIHIMADPSQISQVIINLVVNALHAMPDGGALTIESLGSDKGISIGVEDTGTGMSEKVKSQLFTPFFTTKDVDKGTGLGLPVAHGIVGAHGGTIKVESAPGGGTRFEVHLPIDSRADQKE